MVEAQGEEDRPTMFVIIIEGRTNEARARVLHLEAHDNTPSPSLADSHHHLHTAFHVQEK